MEKVWAMTARLCREVMSFSVTCTTALINNSARNKTMLIIVIAPFVAFTTQIIAFTAHSHGATSLPEEAYNARQYREIVVRHQPSISQPFNDLEAAERIMSYYLYRAILPANRILANQQHRHAQDIIDLFTQLYRHRTIIEPHLGTNFIEEVKTYLVYLATNHGHYFKRLNTNNKRTPDSLNLTLLTPNTIKKAMQLAPTNLNEETFDTIFSSLFVTTYEQTLMTPGSIDESATNFHSLFFDNLDFELIPIDEKGIHAYYDINKQGNAHVTYPHVGGRFNDELAVTTHWLEKAYTHAQSHPYYFDEHFTNSLGHLIAFFKTGKEEEFKEHFKDWIHTNSSIDYSLGFIETQDDPMKATGSMQGEVTIKHHDQEKLNRLNIVLPDIEETLPLPDEYKRKNASLSRTASLNTQLYATGALGPLHITVAYNLPNYRDIKTEHGTKVILSPTEPSIEAHLNPRLWNKFYFTPEQVEWLDEHDQENRLSQEITELLHCLHETIGHASGKLDTHTFTENDINIGSTFYQKGKTIPVTDENLLVLIPHYSNALEELRAEVIALYVATHHLEKLSSCGFLKEWVENHGTESIIRWILHVMAYRALKRLTRQAPVYLENETNALPIPFGTQQPDNYHRAQKRDAIEFEFDQENNELYVEESQFKPIVGVYAQANAVITNYLIEQGAAVLKRQNVIIDGESHAIATIQIVDIEKGREATKKLMQQVQRITSTGDGRQAETLFKQYGRTLGTPDITAIMQQNKKTLAGDAQVFANIYPSLIPVIDPETNEVVDVEANWPADIFEQILKEDERALSTDY